MTESFGIFFLKIRFMKNHPVTDTFNVGIIVPLPNHYSSDMPQGHGAVRKQIRAALFLYFYRLKQLIVI